MSFSRRSFLATAGVAIAGGPSALHASKAAGLRIGITDWNLNQTSQLEAVALAKKLGFDGVQISLGIKPVDQLPGLWSAANIPLPPRRRRSPDPVDGTCPQISCT
jgi:hypothetical protein